MLKLHAGRDGAHRLAILLPTLLSLTAALLLAAPPVPSQTAVQAVVDGTTYDAGSEVRLRIIFPDIPSVAGAHVDIVATLRYAGDTAPVKKEIAIVKGFVPSTQHPETGYQPLWQIPDNARTGRYEVDLTGHDSSTHKVLFDAPRATTFAVHRKLVKIVRIELDRAFYTSGDPVAVKVTLRNLSDRPMNKLQVEFSNRYWPWITRVSERSTLDIFPLTKGLSLPPGKEVEVRSEKAAVAKAVKAPAIQQYGVVVWDAERKNVYDIAFSQLVFVHPPGIETPKPYPWQYAWPNLDKLNTETYRQFYPPGYISNAIQLDASHTMFALGNPATVKFSIQNPTDKPWRTVTLRARLLDPQAKEIAQRVVADRADFDAHSRAEQESVDFDLPASPAGIYRVVVEAADPAGTPLATATLELGVNPLPKSILIFCAHEDDEGAWMGLTRAAVENQIPVHYVYFTSGDAGSCDRYYEHSCSPAEALNFGAIRMEETRRTLGHLGVPREDVNYLGLPDGGSGVIWYHHLDPALPYLSVLLACDHAPYEGLFQPNLPYARNAVVEAVKKLVKQFQPEVAITAHPGAEGHIDHIVNNYFVVKALQQLKQEGTLPPHLELRVDRIYEPKEHPATPYHYEEHTFYVSGEAAARAQESGWYYQSQGANRSQANFQPFIKLSRPQLYRVVLDWSEHQGWNEKE